jgi:hypothetical protein
MGQQSWQRPQGAYQQVDNTPQLPQPQFPGQPQPVASVPTQQAMPQPQPTPAYATPTYSDPSATDTSKRKAIFVAIAVVIALLGLSIGAYLLMNAMNGDKPAAPTTNDTTQQEQKPTTASLTSLNDITFLPPSDLARYTANTENTELVMAYNTEGDGCSLQLGVVDDKTLPGKDFEDIVSRQIASLREADVKVDGPTKADDLKLKDVSNANKTYTLPTMTFVATDKANKQVRSHYSAAVLKNGKRAYITRTCQVANGTVDAATLKPLDDDAAQITVRVR